MTWEGKRIWVAGHTGMVGSALLRRLAHEKGQVLTVPRQELDLRNQSQVQAWLQDKKPHMVILCAAKVGGIYANETYPAEFMYDNLSIESNVIHGSWLAGVEKLLFLGSSCIYPRLAPQPIPEEALLSGPLEPTNEWYALAKIAGLKLCQAYRRQYGCNFISAMPTNLYGPGDLYDLEKSHVIPALIHKIHQATEKGEGEVALWGTGQPRREFLFVEDLADALVFMLQKYEGELPLNVGTGQDQTILETAEKIAQVIGFKGRFQLTPDKPDGTPRKLLDGSRLSQLGWQAKTDFLTGMALTYGDYLKRYGSERKAHG
jgi:GDP-L-fucose synthase